MTQPEPRHPTSDDEELLEAETLAILSEYTDAQRVLRIQDELREGFRQLNHVGKAVSIFGSARTPPEHPRYEQARQLARHLGEQGYAIITGGGPGIMEAANRGAQDVGATSIGLGIELPHEQSLNDVLRHRHQLPLLLHAEGDVRPLRERVRGLPGRVRHARRAVRGGDAAPDAEDPVLPDRAVRQRVLVRAGGLAQALDAARTGTSTRADVESLVVTDDPNDCHGALDAVEHRRPRSHRKAA